jgi:SAM-dependent methyltransferase
MRSILGRYWPQRVGPAEPLAAALLDHHRTGRPRRVRASRADGVSFEIETEEYFTLEGSLSKLDALAIDRCSGRVLDVGAGAGRHALALEQRGLEVVAIDISPTCTTLCTLRGVKDARCFDVMTLDSTDQLGTFDTIFFGMQTIGVAGGIEPLGRLLERLQNCLAPGGEIIVDSSALREAWDGDETDLSPKRGEIVLSTRYHGLRGAPFPWLYLAEDDLDHVSTRVGLEMETLDRVEGGEYLAVLKRADPSTSTASQS